jgi:hypothetical protein
MGFPTEMLLMVYHTRELDCLLLPLLSPDHARGGQGEGVGRTSHDQVWWSLGWGGLFFPLFHWRSFPLEPVAPSPRERRNNEVTTTMQLTLMSSGSCWLFPSVGVTPQVYQYALSRQAIKERGTQGMLFYMGWGHVVGDDMEISTLPHHISVWIKNIYRIYNKWITETP